MMKYISKWNEISLVIRIVIGMTVGLVCALLVPNEVTIFPLFGSLFIGALKGIAPLLVFFLVISAIAQYKKGQQSNMKSVVGLYLVGTFIAGSIAVIGSMLFPVQLTLTAGADNVAPPGGIGEVMNTLLMNIVANPISALVNANYIGILFWAVLLGVALKGAQESTKNVVLNISEAVSQVVKWIISFAPFGILGIVYESISAKGIDSLAAYGKLLALLVGCMIFFALIINPFIAWLMMRRNPYPLVLRCLKESGITAFFTRSSAANIPVNMKLCKDLGLNKDTYAISIPLGATINMAGAAITISVLSLAAAHTLGIEVDLGSAIILSVLSAISACGASGVAGGSLLLVPLACSLFGISNDVAMQVVAVGFIIGVVQDSFETALNSSTDVLYTAIAQYRTER
ncbi:MAG: serine/threonine transporter SstT [Bacilli bacterium]